MTWLAIVLLALVVRGLYLMQAATFPLFDQLIVDAKAYYEWAREIAAGDWLGAGRGVFYQAPLYPYFLAVLMWLGLGDPSAIRLAQIVLGSIACGWLLLAGRRWFDRRAGLAAALLGALYAPAIFTDGLIQKESLGLFLMALVVWLFAFNRDAPSRAGWAALGAALGLLALLRETTLVLIPLLPIWLLVNFCERRRSERLAWALAVGVGAGAILLPVALRNLWVGGELVLTTAQSGPNFYIGNGPQATGTYVALVRGRSDTRFERDDATRIAAAALGRPLSSSEVSRYWWDRAFESIRRQPGRWLALMGRKLWMLLHAYEIPDAEDYA
ncbi:MAG TPA: glycosyltransferase family 39 protein, partial [Acidobacteriota bacterium]